MAMGACFALPADRARWKGSEFRRPLWVSGIIEHVRFTEYMTDFDRRAGARRDVAEGPSEGDA